MADSIARVVIFVIAVFFFAGTLAVDDPSRVRLARMNATGAVVGALTAWAIQARKGRPLTRKRGALAMAAGAMAFGLAWVVSELRSGDSATLIGRALGGSMVNAALFSLFAVALFAKAASARSEKVGTSP